MGKLRYEDITYRIRGAFFEVFNTLGSGFKESLYHNALKEEFKKNGLNFEEKERIPVNYKGKKIGIFEPDFIIENKIIVEIKSVPHIPKLFEKQLYNYLKGTNYELGFLVNFGSDKLEIVRRIVG